MKDFRRKILLLVLLSLAVCPAAWADVAITEKNFPDTYFRSYVVSNFDTDKNSILTNSEIEKATEIKRDTYSWYASNLKGIEYLTALTKLDWSGGNLTTLDVSKNTALTDLDCQSNKLTTLDVSKNTALMSLRCSGNRLAALDVSKNTALTELYCDHNYLTALNVTKNAALRTLWLQGNQLTSVNLSSNTFLTSLACNYVISNTSDNSELSFSAFKRAYGLSIALNDTDYVRINYGISQTSVQVSSIKDESSGNLVIPKSLIWYGTVRSLYFSLYGGMTIEIYPAVSSGSSANSETSPGSKPTVTTEKLDAASVGSPYSFQLAASGNTPITWSFSGNLPDGLIMSTSGLISGTPAKKGNKSFTAIATNSEGSGKKKLSMTIYEAPEIVTDTLNDVVVGKKYS